jgi:hypothetical protein
VVTDEPAVLTWMIALAPRPGYRVSPPGRHWWRELVTDLWRNADHTWWLAREAFAVGNRTEMAEFQELHPRPMLRDFMVGLSQGSVDPDLPPRSGLFA